MRISSGSAAMLGLIEEEQLVPPTTCYLLAGDACRSRCAHCTENLGKLSRIAWPDCRADTSIVNCSGFMRACIQCTDSGLDEAVEFARLLSLPVSISYRFNDPKDVDFALASAGIACIPVDAVNESEHLRFRHSELGQTLGLIRLTAKKHKGRIATHVVIGLGESLHEVEEFLLQMRSLGVIVGLFAYTPSGNTGMLAPSLERYRKAQVMHYRIMNRSDKIAPEAFQASGCPGCNRPFYNERPRGPWYNFPRPLSTEEYHECLALAR
jgi:lipoyl synthase